MPPKKVKTVYVCQQCGYQSPRWVGQCPDCSEWNTLVEQVQVKEPRRTSGFDSLSIRSKPQRLREVDVDSYRRWRVPMEEFNRVLGGGVVPGSLTLIGGDPGIGKCLVGSTRILDPVSGALLPITEWAHQQRPVLSLDHDTHGLASRPVAAFYDRGVQPVVEVTTRLGRTLRCTPTHPVLTPDGWKAAGELSPGDRIATPRVLPYFGNEAMAEHELKLIAYSLSDGSSTSQSKVTTAVPEIKSDLTDIAQQFGLQLRVYAKPNNRAKQFRFVQPLGQRADAETKAIPDCIFRLPRAQLMLFLKTLFSCDGSVYVNQHGQPGISYSTLSQRLAQDVQHLLLRFGFVTKLRKKISKVNGQPYTAYEIQLLGVSEVMRFLSEIGIDGREEAKAQIVALANAYPSPDLQRLAHGEVYWDEIQSITPAGEERVYDLSVPSDANFVANDLIVHNSTLLLQISALMADAVGPVLYVSAEESVQQIKMRADRLGINSANLYLLSEINLDAIIQEANELKPKALIVDSIQTVFLEDVMSSAGSIAQVRECASRLQHVAKGQGLPIFIVGHVTKTGAIAGPRVLEHIVDVVLYLEGDRFHAFRLLRSTKNRFGATNEVGVFAMEQGGMVEVLNPSEAFLVDRAETFAGSAIAVTMEGSRPLLVEIQALTSTTSFTLPRRTGNGVDLNRMLLMIAVLSKRLGMNLSNQDVFVNVVGGLKVNEPAADLSLAAAIASSYRDQPIAIDMAIMGEVGLSGELRSVSQAERRLSEAAKLGYRRCVVPHSLLKRVELPDGLELIGARNVGEALEAALQR